jgi:hypothetical protein
LRPRGTSTDQQIAETFNVCRTLVRLLHFPRPPLSPPTLCSHGLASLQLAPNTSPTLLPSAPPSRLKRVALTDTPLFDVGARHVHLCHLFLFELFCGEVDAISLDVWRRGVAPCYFLHTVDAPELVLGNLHVD